MITKKSKRDAARGFMICANKLYFWKGTTKEERMVIDRIRGRLLDELCPSRK